MCRRLMSHVCCCPTPCTRLSLLRDLPGAHTLLLRGQLPPCAAARAEGLGRQLAPSSAANKPSQRYSQVCLFCSFPPQLPDLSFGLLQ